MTNSGLELNQQQLLNIASLTITWHQDSFPAPDFGEIGPESGNLRIGH